jgi:hypothetical protein
MAYKQVHELLDRIKRFHRQLEDIYEELEDDNDDPRARLLLDYLRRHEKHFTKVLARYGRENDSGVLDTWIQYDPEEDLDRAMDEAELRPEMSLDELLEQAQRFNRAVMSYCRQLADQVNAPRVQELMASLLAMEEGKDSQYSRSAVGLVEEGEAPPEAHTP